MWQLFPQRGARIHQPGKKGTAAILADMTGTDRASETQSLTASQKTQRSYQETIKVNKMPRYGTWYHNAPWKIKKTCTVL